MSARGQAWTDNDSLQALAVVSDTDYKVSRFADLEYAVRSTGVAQRARLDSTTKIAVHDDVIDLDFGQLRAHLVDAHLICGQRGRSDSSLRIEEEYTRIHLIDKARVDDYAIFDAV